MISAYKNYGYEFTVCNVCEATDSRTSNGDCEGCSECYAIEQGFKYMSIEHDLSTERVEIYIDEDSMLYNENLEVIGCAL